MAGPVYNCVWMFLCTLYPAYASFKAVKTKNVKEYVKCMMYWIVFSIFSAETLRFAISSDCPSLHLPALVTARRSVAHGFEFPTGPGRISFIPIGLT